MPRAARVVIPGCPHHLTQRGNNRQPVFFVDDDRRVYLELLREQAERFELAVVGYCLMTNHIHLVVTPLHEQSLAKAIGSTHLKYTRYINRLHGRCGHLWQDRFFSSPLDGEYFWRAMRYVERNPVRARLVRRAWRYAWSSAAAHVRGKDATGLLDLADWREAVGSVGDWSQWLTRPEDEAVVARLRRWTLRGCPLGSDSFVSKLERTLGRRLRPLPVGRPRKPRKTTKTNKTMKTKRKPPKKI